MYSRENKKKKMSSAEASTQSVLLSRKHAYNVHDFDPYPVSILRKSASGRHRPVSYPDGPMTARYRFT